MADSFGLKIGLEGEKEFKKALADINPVSYTPLVQDLLRSDRLQNEIRQAGRQVAEKTAFRQCGI